MIENIKLIEVATLLRRASNASLNHVILNQDDSWDDNGEYPPIGIICNYATFHKDTKVTTWDACIVTKHDKLEDECDCFDFTGSVKRGNHIHNFRPMFDEDEL